MKSGVAVDREGEEGEEEKRKERKRRNGHAMRNVINIPL
jgi:hypothetical protein